MKKALVIIDMLNEFVYGKLGFEMAREIVPNIKRLLERSREKGVMVVFVCDSHRRGDPELEVWGEHAMEGTSGAEVVDSLRPLETEPRVKKRTYNGFFNTDLEDLLKVRGVGEVILTGILTDICILHTAAGAFFRGFKVLIPREAVASSDEESHQRALEYMERMYGAKISSLREVLDSI